MNVKRGKKPSRWNKFLNGDIPYVVLDKVLYRTDKGHVQMAWLCARTGNVYKDTPTERVGTIPESLEESLNHRGTKLTCMGPFPLP